MNGPMLVAITPRLGSENHGCLKPPGVSLSEEQIEALLNVAKQDGLGLHVEREVNQVGIIRTGQERLALVGVDTDALRRQRRLEEVKRSLESWFDGLAAWIATRNDRLDWDQVPSIQGVYDCNWLADALQGIALPLAPLRFTKPSSQAPNPTPRTTPNLKGSRSGVSSLVAVGLVALAVFAIGFLGLLIYHQHNEVQRMVVNGPETATAIQGDDQEKSGTNVQPEDKSSKTFDERLKFALEQWDKSKADKNNIEDVKKEFSQMLGKPPNELGDSEDLKKILVYKYVKHTENDSEPDCRTPIGFLLPREKTLDDLVISSVQTCGTAVEFRKKLIIAYIRIVPFRDEAKRLVAAGMPNDLPEVLRSITLAFAQNEIELPAIPDEFRDRKFEKHPLVPVLGRDDWKLLDCIKTILLHHKLIDIAGVEKSASSPSFLLERYYESFTPKTGKLRLEYESPSVMKWALNCSPQWRDFYNDFEPTMNSVVQLGKSP